MIIKVQKTDGSEPEFFNSEKDMVMVVMSAVDKQRILGMPPDYHTYCTFPKSVPPDKVEEFKKNPLGGLKVVKK